MSWDGVAVSWARVGYGPYLVGSRVGIFFPSDADSLEHI